MKIYMSGKFTNTEPTACKEKFAFMEEVLSSIGVIPVNPFYQYRTDFKQSKILT